MTTTQNDPTPPAAASDACRPCAEALAQAFYEQNVMDITGDELEFAIRVESRAKQIQATQSAQPSGVAGEWRWVDEKGRAMTNWKQGDPPTMSAVSDDKGVMRVEVRTSPPIAQQGGGEVDAIIARLQGITDSGYFGNAERAALDGVITDLTAALASKADGGES